MSSDLSPSDETYRTLEGRVLVDFDSAKFQSFSGHMDEELEKLIQRWAHLAAPAASHWRSDRRRNP